MATRGLYKFYNDVDDFIDVYNHYDNYPEGAAVHLRKLSPDSGKNLISRFVNAIPESEIQIGESNIGWIEYIYELRGEYNSATIKAWTVVGNKPEDCIFDGKLSDFISKYYKEEN